MIPFHCSFGTIFSRFGNPTLQVYICGAWKAQYCTGMSDCNHTVKTNVKHYWWRWGQKIQKQQKEIQRGVFFGVGGNGSFRVFYDPLLLASSRSNDTLGGSQSGRHEKPVAALATADALWGLRRSVMQYWPVPARPLFGDGNSAPNSIVEQSRAVHHRLSICSHLEPRIPPQDLKNKPFCQAKSNHPFLYLDMGFQIQGSRVLIPSWSRAGQSTIGSPPVHTLTWNSISRSEE